MNFLKNANTTAFTGDSAVEAVETSAGSVPADLVVVGIGGSAVDLASSAGLTTENGVVVDEPDAHLGRQCAGDRRYRECMNTLRGERLRVEHWDNSCARPSRGLDDQRRNQTYDWQPCYYRPVRPRDEYVGRGSPDTTS